MHISHAMLTVGAAAPAVVVGTGAGSAVATIPARARFISGIVEHPPQYW